DGQLHAVAYHRHPVFGVDVPATVPGVPSALLDPRQTWADVDAYDKTAAELAERFVANFHKFTDFATADILAGAPTVAVAV
ncbi:hypothetical protein SAMN06269173_1041, partial [Hymenobacter mucosus]